jgi:acetyl esterase/lipase
MRVLARRRFISLTAAACIAGAASAAGVFTSREREHKGKLADGVAYGASGRQRLDVYAPSSHDGSMRPVVVYFYGGGWQSGHRADARGVACALSSRGIVTVTPDYRIYPEAVFPGFLDDPAAAVRWTRDHAREFGGDPARIFVMGHSSGAHIASMLATDPRYLAARGMSNSSLSGMIGLAGPYAAIPTSDPHMDEIFPVALRARALPIAFLTGNEPPMLLAAGTADTDVDPHNSTRFADALRAHHDSVVLKRYAGYGHDTIVKSFSRPDSPVLADVTAFIDAHRAR